MYSIVSNTLSSSNKSEKLSSISREKFKSASLEKSASSAERSSKEFDSRCLEVSKLADEVETVF